jgi:hypothetical protein
MMQRLLTVTSGYLKFTFACMLAGTAAFFLTGLAIAAPSTFLIVMVLAAGLFLVVRMEVKSHCHARELSKKTDPSSDPTIDIKALVKYLAFAEATTTVLLSGVYDEIRIDAPALWVSEWHHTYDPTTTPESALMDKAVLEKAKMASAAKDLQQLQRELASHGLYILSISKMPAEEVVKSIRNAVPSGTLPQIFVSHHGATKTERSLSILFLHDTRTPVRVEVVQKLLQKSFQIVRTRGDLQSRSTLS